MAMATAINLPRATADERTDRIESLLSKTPPQVRVGAVVVDLRTGRRIYRKNAERSMIPASVQKLLVMAAAVDRLGPSFEFKTVLGVLGDDLVVIGSGDPATGDPQLSARREATPLALFESWADALKKTGRSRITGDLVIDESIFDDVCQHPSWDTADRDKWYAAPVGALNFNDNCVEFTVRPNEVWGLPPAWTVFPPTNLVTVVNRAKSTGKGTPIIARPKPTFEFVLTGRCGRRATLRSAAIPDPGLFFADVLRTVLADAGVTIDGRIVRRRVRGQDGAWPIGLEVVAIERTPLTDVLSRIGQNSQNLFADCLFKRSGYEWQRRSGVAAPVGSWPSGRQAIESWLDAAGIDRNGMVIADASGLSRDNRISPRQLVDVLVFMNRHKRRSLFASNLARPGAPGSLAKRMRDLGGEVVAAKTGTMRGVTALAGYVFVDQQPAFAFAVMFSGYSGGSGRYRKLQDDLCRILANVGTAKP